MIFTFGKFKNSKCGLQMVGYGDDVLDCEKFFRLMETFGKVGLIHLHCKRKDFAINYGTEGFAIKNDSTLAQKINSSIRCF